MSTQAALFAAENVPDGKRETLLERRSHLSDDENHRPGDGRGADIAGPVYRASSFYGRERYPGRDPGYSRSGRGRSGGIEQDALAAP